MEYIGPFRQGGFILDTERIGKNSIVYSLGVGDNVEWDKEMIERFGCNIYAYDPDPRAIAWFQKQTMPPEFHFHPLGVSNFAGVQTFYQPHRSTKVDASTVRKTPFIERLPVARLASIMRQNGHSHIDVLKVNIEGTEFAILPDIIKIKPKQLIIEFHGRYLRYTGAVRTFLARIQLFLAGYRQFALDGHTRSYAIRGSLAEGPISLPAH